MNTSNKPDSIRILTIICWIVCALVLIGLAVWIVTGNLFGIDTGESFFSWGSWDIGIESGDGSYEEQGSYSIAVSDIDSITVDWVAGSVDITPYDGDEIYFVEYARRSLDENEVLQYTINNKTLTIKYREKQNFSLWDKMPEKKLELLIPYTLAESLLDFNVDSVSGAINAEGIRTDNLMLATTSGTINATGLNADSMRLDTTSGAIRLSDIETNSLTLDTISGGILMRGVTAYKINANSTSGSITFEETYADNVDADTISGRVDIEGGFGDVSAGSTSGSVNIKSSEAPDAINVDTVSGSVTITIPETDNLSVSFDSVSGSFNSDLPVTMGGKASYKISTVSGSLKIKTND